MGRPKLDRAKALSKHVLIRALPAEVETWKRAAKEAGQSLSAWLRAAANAALEKRSRR